MLGQLKEGFRHSLDESADLEPLFQEIKRDDARYALLGEASHGTSEFYTGRMEITKRLVAEHQFSFIAVEGAWPGQDGPPESNLSSQNHINRYKIKLAER